MRYESPDTKASHRNLRRRVKNIIKQVQIEKEVFVMKRQCPLALWVLLGIALWAAAAEQGDRPIELLVRGDDMGHTLDVNQGFIKAHIEGILTSASLMAPAPYFDDAVIRCKAHPKLAPGIHVTLMATVPCDPFCHPTKSPA